jgi:DNA polymerase-3 subunit delta'
MNDLEQSLPWLQPSWSQLSRYIHQKRIPQALLIIGKKGLGKQQLAEYYAQSLLCAVPLASGIFCGDCSSCLLFKAQTHPDYTLIQPEQAGKAIGISVIRQLTTKLTLKPQFDANRVVIINSADSLNNASANAFLKYLEEPTERTSIILITDSPNKLPATIKSRCQKLNILLPDESELITWLRKQGVVEDTELLINLSQRAPLLAKNMADSSVLKLRTDCFNDWIKYTHSKMSVVSLAEQWHKLAKTEIDFLMSWLVSWVTDMIKLTFHRQPITIVNIDLKSNLQELVQGLDLKDLYNYYDFLLLRQQKLDTQLNKQLMFEEILIQWTQISNR